MTIPKDLRDYWRDEIEQVINRKVTRAISEAKDPTFLDRTKKDVETRILKDNDLAEAIEEVRLARQEHRKAQEKAQELSSRSDKLESALATRLNAIQPYRNKDGYYHNPSIEERLTNMVNASLVAYLPDYGELGKKLNELLTLKESIDQRMMLAGSPQQLRVFLTAFYKRLGEPLPEDI